MEHAPDAAGESGALLGPLAELHLLLILANDATTPPPDRGRPGRSDVARAGDVAHPQDRSKAGGPSLDVTMANLRTALDAFCSNQVWRPTFLTPELLRRVGDFEPQWGVSNVVSRWKAEWEQHNTRRSLFSAALLKQFSTPIPAQIIAGKSVTHHESSPPFPSVFWFQHPIDPGLHRGQATKPGDAHSAPGPQDLAWLAARVSDGAGGFWIFPQPMSPLGAGLTNVSRRLPAWRELRELFPPIPEWFDCRMEIAGIVVHARRHGMEGEPVAAGRFAARDNDADLLAVAQQVEDGAELFRIAVYLGDAGTFFARQNARTRLFGALIGLAATVGVVGFFSAWRAFRRQQELSEMKSNFVSSVSHELRAPIASVRLLAETLERGRIQEPARQTEYFRLIVQECRRLSSLIENVLEFARMERGRREYDLEPTDLPALVAQTVRLMEPVALAKGVRIENPAGAVTVDSSPPETLVALADAQAVTRALVNLIDNAIKHAPAGSAVIVRLEQSAAPPPPSSGPDRGVVRISVEDSGPGIPAADHERIFERFYRRGSELRRESVGVGIGLSIVKHIMEAHGGRVLVSSAPGQGSRFTLELPLRPISPQPLELP